MKNVLKISMVFLIATLTLPSEAQVRYGIKAGVNANNVRFNYANSDNEPATQLSPGFHVGLSLDLELMDFAGLQTGLIYTVKGFSFDLEDGNTDATIEGYDRITFNYIEIPFHLALKFDPLQIYAGPYVAVGIGGKNKYDYSIEYAGDSYDMEGESDFKPVFGEIKDGDLGDDEDGLNALDYGVNFGVGLGMGPILVNAGYSYGLGNLTPKYEGDESDPADFKISHGVIVVSLTLFLEDLF